MEWQTIETLPANGEILVAHFLHEGMWAKYLVEIEDKNVCDRDGIWMSHEMAMKTFQWWCYVTDPQETT